MRTRYNNFLLDGIDNDELNLNTVIIFPSVDGIESSKFRPALTPLNSAVPMAVSSIYRLNPEPAHSMAADSSFSVMISSTPTICSTTNSATSNRHFARTSSAARSAARSVTTTPSSS
jgi:hypothetical protein